MAVTDWPYRQWLKTVHPRIAESLHNEFVVEIDFCVIQRYFIPEIARLTKRFMAKNVFTGLRQEQTSHGIAITS
ncbi:hypothetical protein TNCT_342281 [Trichonephila clavata]|uniref:Uncharacterized protein n=1 Tax=Trichonephila clavata TaxID=2740835 RepID=A0A8X6L329_TRICU|nr:hypothetical protein TNCT_342281 [Trichonephila clavata]